MAFLGGQTIIRKDGQFKVPERRAGDDWKFGNRTENRRHGAKLSSLESSAAGGVPLITAAEMRATERAAMDAGDVTGAELMERAGEGVVRAILARWPQLGSGAPRALVLCGLGNNGGDGFVIARLLARRGWSVEVWLYGEFGRLSGDAAMNAQRWKAFGAIRHLSESRPTAPVDLFVDAVFGTGLSRPVEADLAETLVRAREAARTVAVDLPSGLCSDSGRVLAESDEGGKWATRARPFDLCVTFHRRKRGHVLAQGPAQSREVVVVDLGLAQDAPTDTVIAVSGDLGKRSGHKFDHGSALVLSGGVGKGGAARLAARAALRVGAGLVTVGCPPAALIENAAQLTAIMLRRLADPAALSEMLEDERINAVCLGPGLGMGEREAGLVDAALASLSGRPGRSLVLDGDALTLLSRDRGLMGRLTADCVLTPHDGEFARLFPDLSDRLAAPATRGPAYSRVDAAREAAARCGAVVVLKGPATVIAGPEGRCLISDAVYDRAVPWLATAGAGDVLAGLLTGLLARGRAPVEAASAAAWLHVEAARRVGPGLIAEDLPDALPQVLRDCGA